MIGFFELNPGPEGPKTFSDDGHGGEVRYDMWRFYDGRQVIDTIRIFLF